MYTEKKKLFGNHTNFVTNLKNNIFLTIYFKLLPLVFIYYDL